MVFVTLKRNYRGIFVQVGFWTRVPKVTSITRIRFAIQAEPQVG